MISDDLPFSLTHPNHSVSPVEAASRLETQAQIPLTDYMSGTLDVLYYGYLNFGTPPQSLSIDIDTGSADLWVGYCLNLGFPLHLLNGGSWQVPSDCASCQTKEFDPRRSTSYQSSSRPFNVVYVGQNYPTFFFGILI